MTNKSVGRGSAEAAKALRELVSSTAKEEAEKIIGEKEMPNKTPYVSESRLKEINGIKYPKYNLAKLEALCIELNVAWQQNSYYSVIFLVRSIIDHVPPVFGMSNFNEVVSNVSMGRSVKKSLTSLNVSSRNIADNHIHSQCGVSQSLPSDVQVNFSQDIDVLLAEVVAILRVT